MTKNRRRGALVRPPDRRQLALADRRTACGRLLWAVLTARVVYATTGREVTAYRTAVSDLWACRAADGYRMWEPVHDYDEADPAPTRRHGRLVENATRTRLQQLADAGLVYVQTMPSASLADYQCPSTSRRMIRPTADACRLALDRAAVPAGVPRGVLYVASQGGAYTSVFDPGWLDPRLGWLAAAADRTCKLQLFQAAATVARVRHTPQDDTPEHTLDLRADAVCLWADWARAASPSARRAGHASVPVEAFVADPACLWHVHQLVRTF